MTKQIVVTDTATFQRVRLLLMVTLVLGVTGVGAELLLLEHTDGFKQLVPVTLLALGLMVLLWHAVSRRAASVRAIQITMALFVASGFIGMLWHYQGNMEFELETYPSISGLALFKEAMMGATPALAPGTMIQLGLIGLAYTYRHPLLVHPAD
jgi:hypothetical protein